MTFPQIAAIAIVAGMMAGFLWGRLRYDLVAGLALAAAVAVGVVPAKDAFKGFADDVVIIIASALVISAAVSRSGVLDIGVRHLTAHVSSVRGLLIALVAAVTVVSAIVKNIGTLAMAIPVAFQLARRKGVSPSIFLMPMAFGALLGGMITLVGTSPNVIVSRVREEMTGKPFQMFDFAPVGLALSVVGVVFLALAYRLIPSERRGLPSLEEALAIADYVTEAEAPEGSAAVGMTIADLRRDAGDPVAITAIVRGGTRTMAPLPDVTIRAGDRLILSGEEAALNRFIELRKLKHDIDSRPGEALAPDDSLHFVEAVIMARSPLIGMSAGDASLHHDKQIDLIALSRRGARLTQRLKDIAILEGDVVVLRGAASILPDRLRALGALPLADRAITLGSIRKGQIAVGILLATIAALAFGLVPVAAGFAAAALAMVAFRAISLDDAYASVEWPIVFMLAALIPVSDSLQATGVTTLISDGLARVATGLPAWGAVATMLVTAMAVTPFLNNAATVLIMAPIASGFATTLGYKPEAFLMAVAVGAACDFLTPIGHQCNTLVMGPGGYRFGDYARLGAPLSLIVIVVGTLSILAFWPVR